MSGWVRIERDVFGHDFFAKEPMSEREAWLWMIAKAAYADTRHRVGADMLDVPRGSFMTTLRELQGVFMWRSDSRVRGFLKRLEAERMVERTTRGPTNAPKTHITICNYDEYQAGERTENAPGTHRERTDERTKVTKINNKQSSSYEEQSAQSAFDLFSALAKRIGCAVPSKLSAPRKRSILARLKDVGGLDGWEIALGKVEASDFLRVSNWFGLDWMLKPANFTKIMEGNYDNRTGDGPRSNNSRASSPHDALMAGFAAFANSDGGTSGDDFGGGETSFHTGNEAMDFGPGGYATGPILRVVGDS